MPDTKPVIHRISGKRRAPHTGHPFSGEVFRENGVNRKEKTGWKHARSKSKCRSWKSGLHRASRSSIRAAIHREAITQLTVRPTFRIRPATRRQGKTN